MNPRNVIGILVGGGPAPGINAVIAGDLSLARPLTIENTSRIHFRGGSYIGISRANPTRSPELLEQTVRSLLHLGVNGLITIGGDDTAFSAMKLEEKAAGRLRVVHVPKTIDNDLDLPPHVDTFGFQTARHAGVEILKNLMVDAKTTSHWYYVIAMGRKAGHLALGIGKAAGATLTLIPEEFTRRPIRLRTIVDTLVGAVIKRLADGRRDGVAVIAEGVVLAIDPQDVDELASAGRDAHGNVQLSDISFDDILRRAVDERLAELGIKAKIVAKNIGYELRCADPIPYDMEYSRDLGYCAAKLLLDGGNGAMISMQAGQFVPVPFATLMDPATGRARVRMVDVRSTRYAIARRYMIRLRRDDFEDARTLERLAVVTGMSVSEFRRQFEPLTEDEPPALDLLHPTTPDYELLAEPQEGRP
jgi:6-phosphofructokinase